MTAFNLKTGMIRTLILFLCLVILFCSAGCGSGKRDAGGKEREAVLGAAARMKEAVSSDEYLNLLSDGISSSELVETVRAQDLSQLKAVYEVFLDTGVLLEALGTVEKEQIDALPDSLRTKLMDRVFTYLVSSLNSRLSSMGLAFVNMFSESGAFLDDTLKERRAFVFVFEGGFPIFAVFHPLGEGIVSYSTQWMAGIGEEQITSVETLLSATGWNQIAGLSAELCDLA